jgi:hypothetical protein
VQAEAQHVHGRLQQLGVHAGQQQGHDAVGHEQVPVPVHRQRRPGFVAVQDALHRRARIGHLGRIERAFAVHRGIARGHQQSVALAQGYVQAMGQAQHHVAAGAGAARFHAAQVARRHVGRVCQVQLAQAPALAPVAQAFSKRRGCR